MCCMYCCVVCCVVTRAGRGFCNTTAAFCDVSAPARPPPPPARPGDTHRKHQKYQNMDILGVLFKYMTTILKNLMKLKL